MRAEASRRRLPGWVARAVPPVDAGCMAGVGVSEVFRVLDLTGVFGNAAPRWRHRPAGEAGPDRLRRPCGVVGPRRWAPSRRPAAARAAGGADRLRLPPHRLRRCSRQLPRSGCRAGCGTGCGRSSTPSPWGAGPAAGAQKTLRRGARLAARGAAGGHHRGRRRGGARHRPASGPRCSGRQHSVRRRLPSPRPEPWCCSPSLGQPTAWGSVRRARRRCGTVPARPVAWMDPARSPTPGPGPWCGVLPGRGFAGMSSRGHGYPTDACAPPARTTCRRPTPDTKEQP